MKKQLRILIILVLAVALLAAAYFIIRTANAEKQAAEDAEDEPVYLYEPELITHLVLENDGGGMDMQYDKGANRWTCTGHMEYAVDLTTMNNLANCLMQARIIRTLDVPDNLADFGLEPPRYVMTLTDDAENDIVLRFGNMAGDGENYYIMRNDEDAVYVVTTEFYMYLDYTLNNCIQFKTLDLITEENLVSVDVSYNDMMITVQKNGDKFEALSHLDHLQIDNSDKAVQDAVAGVVKKLTSTGVKLDACLDYDPTDAELASYGLDGKFYITAHFLSESGAEMTWTLKIGDLQEGTNVATKWYYAKLDTDTNVTHMLQQHATPFLNLVEACGGTVSE